MVEDIVLEVHLFLLSIACGVFLLMVYDLLRILRRIIRQNGFVVALTDLLFWAAGGVFMFTVIYEKNFGTIRFFSLGGMAFGMLVYHNTVSGLFVEGVSHGINRLLSLLKRAVGLLLRPFVWLLRRLGWLFGFIGKKLNRPCKWIIKGLKKKAKTVKIALTKK